MSWAHYILQVNIYLVVFYGFYKLLLNKETYFTLNRIYLISAALLSIAIPFLRFEWFIRQPIAQPVYAGVLQMNEYITQTTSVQETITLGNSLVFLYVVGILYFGGKFIAQLMLVRSLLKGDEKGLAFSFFARKVIDSTHPQFSTIDSHEKIHVQQLHSLDIIFFEVLGIVIWFNPIIYFYKQTIKNIHEYLADEEAAKFQGDKEQYALLLLSSAFRVTPSNLTNSFFNKSLLKKRIYMLHKQRSKKTAVLKYGLFLPLCAVTLVMSSAISKNQAILAVTEKVPFNDPLKTVTGSATTESSHSSEISTVLSSKYLFKIPVQEDKVHDFVSLDKQPTFPGGFDKFYEYLSASIKYPAEAAANKTQGKVILSFVVEKDGSLKNIKVERPLGSGTDEEAIRVLKESPKWIPGVLNGRAVRVKYNIPINFSYKKKAE